MKALWLSAALCFFLLMTRIASAQCSKDLIGMWHNDLKVSLTITAISPAGQLTGTYVSAPGASGQVFPLVGWVSPVEAVPKKDHVVPVIFTARWDPYGSITVWTGYLSKGKDGVLTITTIWNVVRADADPDNALERSEIKSAIFKPGLAR
jgi:hypothetical protein